MKRIGLLVLALLALTTASAQYLGELPPPPAGMGYITYAYYIDSGNEDATRYAGATETKLDVPELNLGQLPSGQRVTVGLYYDHIYHPIDGELVFAQLQFKAKYADSSPASITVRGVVSPIPSGPYTTSSTLSGVLTSAQTTWTVPTWRYSGHRNRDQNVNITQVAQEAMYDIPDKVSLILRGTGTRRAWSYETSNGDYPDTAPVLYLTFLVPGP